jgi:DNA-binding protein HU-beta/DNA-binding protein HU-alpha
MATPKPVAVPSAEDADAEDGPIKKGPLLDKVAERSGIKRSDAKAVMEAIFAVMGEELRNENDMQLPPLGKLKVIKSKDVGKGATAITLKLRTPNTES